MGRHLPSHSRREIPPVSTPYSLHPKPPGQPGTDRLHNPAPRVQAPLSSGLGGFAMLSRASAMTLTPSTCSSPQWYRNTDTTCHQGHMALRMPTSPKAWSVRPRWRSATPSAMREPSHEKTVAPAGSEILVYPTPTTWTAR